MSEGGGSTTMIMMVSLVGAAALCCSSVAGLGYAYTQNWLCDAGLCYGDKADGPPEDVVTEPCAEGKEYDTDKKECVTKKSTSTSKSNSWDAVKKAYKNKEPVYIQSALDECKDYCPGRFELQGTTETALKMKNASTDHGYMSYTYAKGMDKILVLDNKPGEKNAAQWKFTKKGDGTPGVYIQFVKPGSASNGFYLTQTYVNGQSSCSQYYTIGGVVTPRLTLKKEKETASVWKVFTKPIENCKLATKKN